MIINTNIAAIFAHNNLKQTGATQKKASTRLSSGMRINSAADDAAGLAISEKMRAQIRGLDQAHRNIEDGISLFSVGDGALSEVNDMIARIKELAVQAANDTNTDEDRAKLDDELSEILEEIDGIAERTEFNKIQIFKPNTTAPSSNLGSLLKGVVSGRSLDTTEALNAANFLTPPAGNDEDMFTFTGSDGVSRQYLFKMDDYLASDVYNYVKSMYNNGIPVSKSDKEGLLNRLVNALNAGLADSASQYPGVPAPTVIGGIMKDGRIVLGTSTGQIFNSISCPGQVSSGGNMSGFVHSFLHTGLDYYSAAGSIEIGANDFDTDMVTEDKRSLWIQMGANASQGQRFEWNTLSSSDAGLANARLTPLEEAVKTLKNVDYAVGYVTKIRSQFGGYINRLEYALNSALVMGESMSNSESRIRDADMAKEMMNLTKSQVLMQASTSMLAQANQSPQSVLQLLQ